MKYNVMVIVKEIINLNIDADSEETASELVYGELHNTYDLNLDADYEIKSITRVEDQNENNRI